MPTRNRRPCIRAAIGGFLDQDWPNSELLIMADGERLCDLIPPGGRIRYYHCQGKRALGWKRNALASAARGAVLAHWDDDDWYHPYRLTEQYQQLMLGGHDLIGYSEFGYWDERHGSAFRYWNPDPQFMCGSSMMYRKSAWAARPFYDTLEASEDIAFMNLIERRHGYNGMRRMVARVHALSIGAMRQTLDLAREKHIEQVTDSIAEIDPEQLPAEFPRGVKIAA